MGARPSRNGMAREVSKSATDWLARRPLTRCLPESQRGSKTIGAVDGLEDGHVTDDHGTGSTDQIPQRFQRSVDYPPTVDFVELFHVGTGRAGRPRWGFF
jgi:hypothetical protein